jgi:hypothetical protein
VPYRRDATDRAGMNAGAVEAAAAARLGLATCTGWITEPAHYDAADPPRRRPESRRRCMVPLDPALIAAGFRSHPCCDPAEVSPIWPPMPWPERILPGERDVETASAAKRHRWPKHATPGECRVADRCLDCGLLLNDAKRGGGPCTPRARATA